MGPDDGVGPLNVGDPLLSPLAGHTDASRLGPPQSLSEGRESEVTYIQLVVPEPYSASSFSWGAVCFLCLLCVWVKPLARYLSVLWNTPTRASSDYFKHWTLQGRKEVWVQWVRTLLWMGASDLQ